MTPSTEPRDHSLTLRGIRRQIGFVEGAGYDFRQIVPSKLHRRKIDRNFEV
jgi:hypothetical protein